ncbi:hypothetical protein BGX29_003170 [Mortierella sp. GBA35]|nr:hypothetical protein BGX29_003170 [Mortierella sp. GBA35]
MLKIDNQDCVNVRVNVPEPEPFDFGDGYVCLTEGHVVMPSMKVPTEIIRLDVNGPHHAQFIPLWAQGVVLRYRFRDNTPEDRRESVRILINEALARWGANAPVGIIEHPPVGIIENADAWDFDIDVRASNHPVRPSVKASAFFPNEHQNTLTIFPPLFLRTHQQQVDTLTHEIGHIFGLRHSFANTREARPSVLFGTDCPLSIMSYRPDRSLTNHDANDLVTLYTMAWSGDLTAIGGKNINLLQPFHAQLP